MTLLSEYYVPGLHIEDRSIKVPLDWIRRHLQVPSRLPEMLLP